jgi:polysaccharide pyruvyl transferase WcaK-like protein
MNNSICLFYAWGSSNAGDHALTLGAVTLVRLADQDAEITVISRYGREESEFETSRRKLLEFDSRLTVYPSPLAGSQDSTWNRIRQRCSGAIQSAIAFSLPGLAQRLYASKDAYRAIENCDWALQNGGNLYYWNQDRKAISRLVAFAFPLRLTKSRGAKVGLLPQTIGRLDGWVGKRIANFIASTEFVMFRDSDSKENLYSVATPKNPTAVVPDLAFYLPKQDPALAAGNFPVPEKFIAVTLRDESLGDYGVADYEEDRETTRRRIIELFPPAFEKIYANCQLPFVIVVQVARDLEISNQLQSTLETMGIPACVVECYEALMLMSLYGSAEILIAQRLHSQIFALNNGTPSIGIWRARLGTKIPSMMADLECDRYCHEFEKVTSVQLAESATELIEKRGEIVHHCEQLLAERKEAAVSFLASALSREPR